MRTVHQRHLSWLAIYSSSRCPTFRGISDCGRLPTIHEGLIDPRAGAFSVEEGYLFDTRLSKHGRSSMDQVLILLNTLTAAMFAFNSGV